MAYLIVGELPVGVLLVIGYWLLGSSRLVIGDKENAVSLIADYQPGTP